MTIATFGRLYTRTKTKLKRVEGIRCRSYKGIL